MLVTVKQFVERYPLSERTVRKLIAVREQELAAFGAVMRVGAKVLIDEQKLVDFFALGMARRIK